MRHAPAGVSHYACGSMRPTNETRAASIASRCNPWVPAFAGMTVERMDNG